MERPYHTVNEVVRVERIYSIFENKFQKYYNFPGEIHNFWECVYIINGSICATADEKVINLSKGQMIIHKPLELHKFFVDDPKGATLFIFTFSLAGNIGELLENKVCQLDLIQQNVMRLFLQTLESEISNDELDIRCNNEINWMPLLERRAEFSQLVASYISQLLILVSRSNSVSSFSTETDAEIFRKTVAFIDEHIDEFFTVKQLSEMAGISQSGLQRIFNKYAQMGVHKYYIRLKIKAATAMLHEGYSVCEVAYKLGFSEQAYFSYTYKRETGKNPSSEKLI